MRCKWLHRSCDLQMSELARARDTLEGEVYRLKKHLDDLTLAHQALIQSMASKAQTDVFSRMVSELFTEVPVREEQKEWLHPALEDREGLGT